MKKTKPLLLIMSAAMLLSACSVVVDPSSSQSSSSQPSTSSVVSSSSSSSSSSLEPSSSSSSSSSSQVQKATIALGAISHATTSLKAGEYELNKAIVFTITADKDYAITEVKINDVAVPVVQGGYSFTPTEVKTYTLTVGTSEIVKKATIALGTLSHASTNLKAGEYELNKAIVFTVTPDKDYAITEVKINDTVVPVVQGGYSFTPTEEKTYTLTVATSEIVKKATITLGTISHATTSLKAGEYELNKAVVFTVTADDEYDITSVKINDAVVPVVQGGYSFTPTEEKTYTLTVETKENENLVVFNFSDGENFIRKGIQIDPFTLNQGDKPVIENGTITFKEGLKLLVNCRIGGTKDAWMRKITFVFKEGSDKFAPIDEEDKQKYKDGVWTETMVERTDRGTANLPCLASGKVVIDKIIVETIPFAAYKTKITFTGLDNDEKIYVAKEPTQEGYEQRVEYKSDMEFVIPEFYYFVVATNEKHKKYYELPDIVNDKDSPLVYTDAYIEDPTTHQQVHVRFYRIDIPETIVETIPLTVKWIGKNAAKSLRFDDESGNKYVKGYMETNPMESLDIQDGDVVYGKEIKLFSIRPKNGYRDLKLVVNGKEIEPTLEDESRFYKFVVEEKDENTIGFTATKGDDPSITKVNISEKGYLYGGEIEGLFNFEFTQADDHPDAILKTLKFNDDVVESKEIEEHTRYILTAEQTAAFKAASESERIALFSKSEFTEGNPYQTDMVINKGSYTVKVEYRNTSTDPYQEIQPEEAGKYANYGLTGGVDMKVTITPNVNLYIFAIDLNDVRLKDTEYTVDANTGVVTYLRKADRLKLDFLVQTKNQTVTLNPTITEGYKIEGLTGPVNVGQAINLKLAPSDDQHWLEGKSITVTYNGGNIPVSTETFEFTITPIKDVTALNVTIADAPQA